jgi:hypothetical protein
MKARLSKTPREDRRRKSTKLFAMSLKADAARVVYRDTKAESIMLAFCWFHERGDEAVSLGLRPGDEGESEVRALGGEGARG